MKYTKADIIRSTGKYLCYDRVQSVSEAVLNKQKEQTDKSKTWWVFSGPVRHFAFPWGILHSPLTDDH